jgi:hypothetical protein
MLLKLLVKLFIWRSRRLHRKHWWSSNSRVYNKFADGLGDENNIFEYTMSPNPTSDLNIKMADNRNATLAF